MRILDLQFPFVCFCFFRFQFVPQIIFLNSLFGYLSLLIIIKWCTGSKADLYHVMIYMFLSPTDDLGENQLFVGQRNVQVDVFSLPQFSFLLHLIRVFYVVKNPSHGCSKCVFISIHLSMTSLCYYCWPLLLFHGCCSPSLLFWTNNTKMYASLFFPPPLNLASEFVLNRECLGLFLLWCYASSEAPGSVLHATSWHRRYLTVRCSSWFPCSWGIWF